MREEKIKRVLEWLTLKYVKDVQKFLGLANYYYQFIQGFASITRLLYNTVKKNRKWKWTEKQEKAFEELKKKFTQEPVLVVPDLDKNMRIEVDVLNYITGDILLIEGKDGKQRPVTFLSNSLNEIERNYEIHDKEMLVIIKELKSWRYLLEEVQFKFEIQTDHKNLEYFMKAQKLNQRQAQQALYLSRFDFTLKHVLETRMGKANRLSRRPD